MNLRLFVVVNGLSLIKTVVFCNMVNKDNIKNKDEPKLLPFQQHQEL
jgi:hypothetical protein